MKWSVKAVKVFWQNTTRLTGGVEIMAKTRSARPLQTYFSAVIFVNIFLSFIILTQKILVVIGFLFLDFWVDFEDNEDYDDIENRRLKLDD